VSSWVPKESIKEFWFRNAPVQLKLWAHDCCSHAASKEREKFPIKLEKLKVYLKLKGFKGDKGFDTSVS
jgi:hypothetical protein